MVEGLEPNRCVHRPIPTEWTVADVLSHLGSGAEILGRRLEDSLAGVDTPDDAAPAVWDVWNAKTPDAQAADALVADRACWTGWRAWATTSGSGSGSPWVR